MMNWLKQKFWYIHYFFKNKVFKMSVPDLSKVTRAWIVKDKNGNSIRIILETAFGLEFLPYTLDLDNMLIKANIPCDEVNEADIFTNHLLLCNFKHQIDSQNNTHHPKIS